ncbi:hypothetical protein HOY80DRAFT_1045344 [Tuber brumale]|nr:hypothetical protein HOY80DRAFT_1053405 [Tuber brumale]KAG0639352.1 hypothetical protein HOY80DRAFT_1045344 [Tuber brumale]
MKGVSDKDVEKILAEHWEQFQDVDEAMGIGKRAGDGINTQARSLYEKHKLGGQDRTYGRIAEEIKRKSSGLQETNSTHGWKRDIQSSHAGDMRAGE